MASGLYVGKPATTDQGVMTRLSTDAKLTSGPNRTSTDSRVAELAEPLATKTYVDTADAGFADVAYYTGRDALNVPNSARGSAGGVASLDGSGKIPSAQLPALGFGTIRGPWGVKNTYSGTTGTTPLKVADFVLGVTAWNFRPLVHLVVQLQATHLARPVVEVRLGGPDDASYASQILVASGKGRAAFDDIQAVPVLSADALGAMASGLQTYYSPNLDARLTVWVYNGLANDGQLTAGTAAVWAGAVHILRVLR